MWKTQGSPQVTESQGPQAALGEPSQGFRVYKPAQDPQATPKVLRAEEKP